MRIFNPEERKELHAALTSEELEKLKFSQVNADRNENDVRIAVIGNVDSGKSTMVGVMTKSIMDDGRGSARQQVFNFSHEQ